MRHDLHADVLGKIVDELVALVALIVGVLPAGRGILDLAVELGDLLSVGINAFDTLDVAWESRPDFRVPMVLASELNSLVTVVGAAGSLPAAGVASAGWADSCWSWLKKSLMSLPKASCSSLSERSLKLIECG